MTIATTESTISDHDAAQVERPVTAMRVVAASRRSGVDVLTGEGLAEALRAASVVVDVSDSPSFEEIPTSAFAITTDCS